MLQIGTLTSCINLQFLQLANQILSFVSIIKAVYVIDDSIAVELTLESFPFWFQHACSSKVSLLDAFVLDEVHSASPDAEDALKSVHTAPHFNHGRAPRLLFWVQPGRRAGSGRLKVL